MPYRFSSAVLMSVLAVIGCEPPVPPEVPVPSVSVSKPLVQNVKRYVELTGRSEASKVFEARARIQAFLKKIEVEEGKDVKAGDILFELEKEPIEAELAAAEASLASTKARAQLAKADLDRNEELYQKKVTTLAEVERFRASYAVAQAAIAIDEAKIKDVKTREKYTTIKSEIDGMVGEVYIDEGNLVGTQDKALLATVQQYDPLYIYFDVPEGVLLRHLRELAEGIRKTNEDVSIEVRFSGETGFPHVGTLKMFDNQIDESTGTSLLRGEIPNPDKRSLPGAYATIRIKSTSDSIENAVLIDERAIGTDLSGKYILIINDKDVVEQRRVLLGQRYHQFRHIVTMWNPDEPAPDPEVAPSQPVPTDFRYVLKGLQKARPGNPVKVSEEVTLTFPKEEAEPEAEAKTEQKPDESNSSSEEKETES